MSTQDETQIGDISPIVTDTTVEIEPMLLLDVTGSMNRPNQEGHDTPRREIIGEALSVFVSKLGAQDSQAAAEQAAEEDAGGLMTITFAGGSAENIGDLSEKNWKDKFNKIQWEGGTRIMPGLRLLQQTYTEEFGKRDAQSRPQMLGLVITDGEADDTDEFANEISKSADISHYVIAVCGYGDEHDRALQVYKKVETQNPHVRVVSFGNTTDPTIISNALTSLLGV